MKRDSAARVLPQSSFRLYDILDANLNSCHESPIFLKKQALTGKTDLEHYKTINYSLQFKSEIRAHSQHCRFAGPLYQMNRSSIKFSSC